MGLLVAGEWYDRWYDTESSGGRFVRESPGFRDWVTADGSSGLPAARGRYHLYVSLACPWAHRTLIFRRLKGLEDAIGVSVVDPYMGENGWTFSNAPGCIPDTVYGLAYLYQLYQKAVPDYTGRVTTPTLWDREREAIVSNESADIIRMFNSAFDGLAGHPERDYYPRHKREVIDAVNDAVYTDINNGVYQAGFATSQQAYEQACRRLFERLDALDARLAENRYLVGDEITEADWRLFTTLVRFDSVYHGHFKCNIRRIVDYPHLAGYLRELYQVPGIAETVDFDHIQQHLSLIHI